MIGQTISHYKITEKLGEGGMGVVYKAEDTKLKRTVALKFLAAHLLNDEDTKERFRREAEAAAALSHSNIAVVYDIDECDGHSFIAMEFVEGLTVGEKVTERPLKLEEALDIAIQAAQGLQAAHERGVVHRDIKSANLMVTPQGQVKVMDFGLAQLAERSKLTETTTVLGTPSYMSPEQAVGDKTDRRTDLWSLGVVLYEMVTGRLPFEGERQEAVLYGITNQEPELVTALRAGLPMDLEWIVGKALAKNRDERYQHAEDLLVDLQTLKRKLDSGRSTLIGRRAAASDIGASQAPSSGRVGDLGHTVSELIPTRMPKRERLAWSLTAVVSAALLGVSLVHFQETPPEAPLRRYSLPLPAGLSPNLRPGGGFLSWSAVSPNGRHIAITAAGPGALWIQDFDQTPPRELAGTQGAGLPFWSPESDYIGFAAGNELKKVSVQGGPVIAICELPTFNGEGSWSPDGESIVFAAGRPRKLYEVAARGGQPSLLSLFEELEESPGGPIGQELTTQGAPHFLPIEAGNHVLIFMKQTLSSRTVDPPSIVVGDLETGRQELLVTGFHPIYSHTGHLVYTADQFGGDLWAVPFSLDTLSVTGEAFPIAQNTRNATVATDQTLVYVDIPESGPEHLVWLDRGGHKTGEIGQPHEAIGWPALSPDGKLLAFTFQARSNEDVWVYDIARETRTRLTSAEGTDMRPVWSPTSEDVGFTSNRAGNRDIYFRRADGSGQAQALLERDEFVYLTDWSKDGRYVLFMRADGISPATPADLWYLERDEGTSDWKPHQFSQSPFHERSAKLSPDGRYVAYVSNESGQNEVYVRPFPEGGRRSTVSSKGGTQAHWSRDGKELFYVEGVTLIAVPVSTGSKFSMGPAKRLFEHSSLAKTPSYPMYDVSADGRFVVVEAAEVTPDRSIHIVQNWYEEFRDREQD